VYSQNNCCSLISWSLPNLFAMVCRCTFLCDFNLGTLIMLLFNRNVQWIFLQTILHAVDVAACRLPAGGPACIPMIKLSHQLIFFAIWQPFLSLNFSKNGHWMHILVHLQVVLWCAKLELCGDYASIKLWLVVASPFSFGELLDHFCLACVCCRNPFSLI
jgi:hypothetical protein